MAPFLGAGTAAVNSLAYRMGLKPQTAATTAPQNALATTGAPQNNLASVIQELQAQNPQGLQTDTGQIIPWEQVIPALQQTGAFDTPQTDVAPTTPVDDSIPGTTNPMPTEAEATGAATGQGGAFGDLMTPWSGTFTAPSWEEALKSDPGIQTRLKLGQQALERSAAAKGTILSGGTLKATERYAQDVASTGYGDVYNRALGEYRQGYNISEANQAKQYNRLAALSGTGQTTANQLAQTGSTAAGNMGNIVIGGANAQANSLQNAAAARASGYAAGGNIWGNTLAGIGNLGMDYYMLSQLLKKR